MAGWHENTHPTDGLGLIRRVSLWMLADGLHLAGFLPRSNLCHIIDGFLWRDEFLDAIKKANDAE